MIKQFNSLDDIQKYYDAKSNTYIFKESGEYIDIVVFNFNLNVESNIYTKDIKGKDIMVQELSARDITAEDIEGWSIVARDIKAEDIVASD